MLLHLYWNLHEPGIPVRNCSRELDQNRTLIYFFDLGLVSYTLSRRAPDTNLDPKVLSLVKFQQGPTTRKCQKKFIDKIQQLLRNWEDYPEDQFTTINHSTASTSNFKKLINPMATIKTLITLGEAPGSPEGDIRTIKNQSRRKLQKLPSFWSEATCRVKRLLFKVASHCSKSLQHFPSRFSMSKSLQHLHMSLQHFSWSLHSPQVASSFLHVASTFLHVASASCMSLPPPQSRFKPPRSRFSLCKSLQALCMSLQAVLGHFITFVSPLWP